MERKFNFSAAMLLLLSALFSTMLGYDASVVNGLNIMPSYTEYFELNTTFLALQSSMVWAGCAIAGLFYGKITDWIGRKKAMWGSAVISTIGTIIQTASQNSAMFVVSRFIVGVGNGAAFLCVPVYLAEVLPLSWRATGLGIFMSFFYVGGLLAAGVTYGTWVHIDSTWGWRVPSLIQGVLALTAVMSLPFVPESPRWLAYQDRAEDALEVLARTHSGGDREDPVVMLTYREIIDTLAEEKSDGRKTSYLELLKTKSSRKALILGCSVAMITMLSGNNIISFYLGSMLTNAGIEDTTTQLEINIILNAFCLLCACIGTSLLDNVGRKLLAIVSAALMAIFIFLFGGLTKAFGESDNHSAVYGTVAIIFLFQGSYSLAWTPLAMLYPAEVLTYSVRSVGMGVYTFLANGCGLMATMAFPYALDAIGWKTYMINGAWDVAQVVFVVIYWVETKGVTLEEMEGVLDKSKQSADIRVIDVLEGKETGLALDGTDVVSVEATSNKIVSKQNDIEV